MPDTLLVSFGLVAKGNIGHKDAFVFRPWVNMQNNINPQFYGYFEDFLLFMPDTLFYNLIGRLLFMEQFTLTNFADVRIVQDIPHITFNRFGLDRVQVPSTIKTNNLELVRIAESEINAEGIINFCQINGYEIADGLKHKYFRPKWNTWYEVKLQNNLIGFIRLYNRNNTFNGGTSIEYVIEKSSRNKGYAIEATTGVINFLKVFSFAISVGAQVNDNSASQRVVEKCGFSHKETGIWDDDNYTLSILDKLEHLINQSQQGLIDVTIDDYYAEKYDLYLD